MKWWDQMPWSSFSECWALSCNVGDPYSIPGLGRSPGEGNGYPLQYSCLENSMDKGAWWATVHGVAKSRTQLKRLSSSSSSSRYMKRSFPGGSDSKESACNAGDPGLIPRSRRSPGGHGNPLQYSCLENSMERGAWQVIAHGFAKSWKWLSDQHTHVKSY